MSWCPECKSTSVNMEMQREEQHFAEYDYYCEACGCEWIEKLDIRITKHGVVEDEI